MSEYFIAPRAQADMDEAWLYIARERPRAADRVIDRLIDQFALLAANPELGEKWPELVPGMRRNSVGNYVILYRPRQGRVEILRVIHGARDIAAEFQRFWPT